MSSVNTVKVLDLPKSNELPPSDIVVIVPTANEFHGIMTEMRSLLTAGKFEPVRGFEGHLPVSAIFFRKRIKSKTYRIIIYCEDIKGNMLSAAHTALLCKMLQPKLIISAGIAGSLKPTNAWIGDILLPSLVENSSFDKLYQDNDAAPKDFPSASFQSDGDSFHKSPIRISDKREKTWSGAITTIGQYLNGDSPVSYKDGDDPGNLRGEQFASLSKSLKEQFNIFADAPKNPRIIRNCRTFSWDKVLDSRDIYNYMVRNNKISSDTLCVEMESWGFLTATELAQKSASFDTLIVRGISDIVGCKGLTDDKHHDLEGECRRLAMSNVAKTVCRIAIDACA